MDSTTTTLRHDLDRLAREIEHLEQQLEAKRAVCAQLQAEFELSKLFPERSGFTRR